MWLEYFEIDGNKLIQNSSFLQHLYYVLYVFLCACFVIVYFSLYLWTRSVYQNKFLFPTLTNFSMVLFPPDEMDPRMNSFSLLQRISNLFCGGDGRDRSCSRLVIFWFSCPDLSSLCIDLLALFCVPVVNVWLFVWLFRTALSLTWTSVYTFSIAAMAELKSTRDFFAENSDFHWEDNKDKKRH